MITAAAVAALTTALASAAGGLQGFFRAGSRASLVAGLVAAAGLSLGGALALGGDVWALWISLVTAVLLAGRFLPKGIRHPRRPWPAQIIALLSVTTATLCAIALFSR